MTKPLLIALCMTLSASLPSIAGDAGTESPFSFGAGARELGLGGSVISRPDPATAVYWNPSALAGLERTAFEAFHSRLYASGSVYQYLGGSMPTMDMGTFGFGLFRLGTDAIERRDENNLLLGLIEDNRIAMYFGYGRTVSSYDLGMALSFEHHSLGDLSATSSPGLNLSIRRQFQMPQLRLPELSVSLCGRNIVRPHITLSGEAVDLPPSFDIAFSAGFVPIPEWNHNLTLSTGISKVDILDPRFLVGLEYDVEEFLHIRGALRDGDPSFGAGLSYRLFSFDYAYLDRDLGGMHMFSVSAGLGMAMSEKRETRDIRRETEFNQLINKGLADRNLKMVADMLNRGEKLMEQGSLSEARTTFDRALFLASGGGMDTTDMYDTALGTSLRLDGEIRKRAFEAHMDSAWAKLSSGDYLAARFFAVQAAGQMPHSTTASDLLDQIDLKMAESETNYLLIERRIQLADSLTSYGRYDEALAAARTLRGVSDDARIANLIKKAEFGIWRGVAEAAFAETEYRSAYAAVDSALSRLPDHPWGAAMNDRISQETKRSRVTVTQAEAQTSRALSDELLKEVDLAYKSGQKLFRQGSLWDAVSSWERVETLAPGYKSVREYLVDAYKFLGVELYTQNRLEEAVDVWKKAEKLSPDSSEISGYIRRTEGEMSRMQEISYEFK
ncbi:MAG: hypothetical protein ABIJ00_05325 [Candidatus Eisenbacteria bacterium]